MKKAVTWWREELRFAFFFLKDLRLELKMSMWCQQQLKQESNPLASFDQDVYENDQAEAKQHRLMESAFLKCFSFLCQSQLSENW